MKLVFISHRFGNSVLLKSDLTHISISGDESDSMRDACIKALSELDKMHRQIMEKINVIDKQEGTN